MELHCVCLTCQRSFRGLKHFLYHIKTVEMVANSVPAHFILSSFGVSLCQAPTTECTYCLCFAEACCICCCIFGTSIQMLLLKIATPQCKNKSRSTELSTKLYLYHVYYLHIGELLLIQSCV